MNRPGPHGKGKTLHPARSANTRTVESVQITEVSGCDHCAEDLRKVRCLGHERRTQFDIVFEKVLTHVDAEIKRCPKCREHTRAAFPRGVLRSLAVRRRCQGLLLNLLIAQMLSLKRAQQSIQPLIGLGLSEATILKVSV